MNNGKIFRIETTSAFPEWDRYSVYMTAVCFGADGEMVDYVNLTEKGAALETPPCDHADLYIYVIAREFPASDVISASPPFEMQVAVSSDGATPAITSCLVNQWGGLSVKLPLI